jgi:hypothetical protein
MGGGAMLAIAKLHGPEKPSNVGVSVGDPQVIARAVRLPAMAYFFRSPKCDLGKCLRRRLHCKPPQVM